MSCVLSYIVLILCTHLVFANFVHHFKIPDEQITPEYLHKTVKRVRRDVKEDEKCSNQEDKFLKNIYQDGERIETIHRFEDPGNHMALAWVGKSGGVLVITNYVDSFHRVNSSIVYRSENYGKTFTPIPMFKGFKVRLHNGVQRNPHNPDKVYLVTENGATSDLFVSEDAGKTFQKHPLPFLLADVITFHSKPEYDDYLICKEVTSELKNLYRSTDNGKSWLRIADYVESFKWSGAKDDSKDTIYATVDPAKNSPFFAAFFQVIYELRKTTDAGRSWTTIQSNVVSFGHQGKFLYASVLQDPKKSKKRIMKVSSDGGNEWFETELPTLDADMFYSVLDMQEDLIFMHVDDPGDTGHGNLYTSAGKGVIYSLSLSNHLYPNHVDLTDFYRVDSMRGVYLASQMSSDNSIHTVITYNRGGIWQPVPRPVGASCKNGHKNCSLQIHGPYSIVERGILAQTPLSVKSAVGIILVHAHVADALQTTHPDVYITSDGGYNWIKALDGPHFYHIADSGSLIVAVPSDEALPTVLKFSTDEGRCWHRYEYITNKTNAIKVTGMITEPGSKSLSVSIWGYHPVDRKWTSIIVDFRKVLKRQCTRVDYTEWTAHATHRADENKNVEGCLLGLKETFTRLKKDSWCFIDGDLPSEPEINPCTCTREDYECDYGYYRPINSENCLKNKTMKVLEICKQGREEKIITVGYRRIPGDVCTGGFEPKTKTMDLAESCKAGDKSLIKNMEVGPIIPPPKKNGSIIAAVVMVVLFIVVLMGVYFGYKVYMLRKHKVVYRYSLLNQSEAADYDTEFENALSPKSVVYQDSSDDEELNGPAVKKGLKKGNDPKSYNSGASTLRPNNGNPFTSYHDDSDVDMLA